MRYRQPSAQKVNNANAVDSSTSASKSEPIQKLNTAVAYRHDRTYLRPGWPYGRVKSEHFVRARMSRRGGIRTSGNTRG